MVQTIDEKDRLILYELDKNSRQSVSKIAKRCRLPKHVVRYRMAEMERRKVIRAYYCVADLTCLGYFNFRVYWKFMDAPPETLAKIHAHLGRVSCLWWVARVTPTYDVVCAGWAKNIGEVYDFILGFKKEFGQNIRRENVAFYTYMKHFPKRYLVPKSEQPAEVPYFGRNRQVKIDARDFHILKALSLDARGKISAIAKSVGLAETAVRQRISNLEKSGVVAGYKVLIDYEAIQMLYFWVHCELRNYRGIDKIEKAIAENPNVVYVDRAAGGSDLEFGAQYSGPRELEAYNEKLHRLFPDDIRELESVTVLKNIKLEYLPEKLASELGL